MAKKKSKDRSGSILDAIHTIHSVHVKLLDRAVSPFNVSNEQCTVLRILSEAPEDGLALKQVQMMMPNNTSNTTRLVDKLAQKKLLRKSTAKTDKRELRIAITAEGRALLAQVNDQLKSLGKSVKKSLKSKNAKLVASELKSMLSGMEKLSE